MERGRGRRERGQVLVIFAGALLLLTALAAVVIDVGFVLMVRRHQQNAADPGAVAAARHIRPTADTASMRRAACFYARQNGLFAAAGDNDGCIPANDGHGTVLAVHYPPSAGAGPFAGRSGFVEVVLSRPHETFFARLFGMRTIPVTAGAVAAYSDGDSNTASMLALDPSSCAAGKVSGGGTITIDPVPGVTGGYVHVNSTCGNTAPAPADNACSAGSGALKVDGGGTIRSPGTYVAGSCQLTAGNLYGPLTENAARIGDPLAELAPPRIADHPAGRCGPSGPLTAPTGPTSDGCKFNSSGTVQLQPGVYYGGWSINNNVTLELATGIYIIAGGGIKLNAGGSITSVSAGGGAPAPVLIFSTDNPAATCPAGGSGCQDSLDFTANSTLALRGMNAGPYRGLLIWQDGKGSKPGAPVTLGGQTNLDVAGTIYAPGALVTLSGGSDLSGYAAVQIISWQWEITGQGNIMIPYDPSQLYQFSQKGLVR